MKEYLKNIPSEARSNFLKNTAGKLLTKMGKQTKERIEKSEMMSGARNAIRKGTSKTLSKFAKNLKNKY